MRKGTGRDIQHWVDVAEEWIAWARTPGHDAFWAYRASLLGFIGEGDGRALDVGCGEGRISRVLKECGWHVTAADPVEAFIAAAKEAQSADEYANASAVDLPFEAGHFDLVVAYNVLMDVEDVPAALKEMRRVLDLSGTLVISIVHPFIDRGRFEDTAPNSPLVHCEPYFGRKRFQAAEESHGLKMHFAGWSQPLENYMAALEEAGFGVTSMREPVPKAGAHWPDAERWRRFPLFLWLKAKPLTV
ncbi:MAG: class I SAM-dependent methyltransferase [Pseudomonadota bacterium]